MFRADQVFQNVYKAELSAIAKDCGEQSIEYLARVQKAMLDAENEFEYTAINRAHFEVLGRVQIPSDVAATPLCLSCMVTTANLRFECGHGLCSVCLRLCADQRSWERVKLPTQLIRYHLPLCPFCDFPIELDLNIHPVTAGLRTLSLDGGGVRGIAIIITLIEFLRRFNFRTGLHQPIQSLFDMFVGTSVGGLIALGLGKQLWNLAQVRNIFIELSKMLFADQSHWRWIRLLTSDTMHPKAAVQAAFSKAFSEDSMILTHCRPGLPGPVPLVVVATIQDGQNKGIITNFEPNMDDDEPIAWFQEPIISMPAFSVRQASVSPHPSLAAYDTYPEFRAQCTSAALVYVSLEWLMSFPRS